jgi:cholesterol transport system auxiliary component
MSKRDYVGKVGAMAVAVVTALLLSACVNSTARQGEVAYYDLGTGAKVKGTQALMLRAIDVQSPSWLGTAAMQYRFAYGDASRRQTYVESRWAATPGELLEVALRRRIAVGESDIVAAGCRLRIDVDEFVQVFDAPDASRAVIEARVSLLAAKSDQLLARRSISLSHPALTADARGGVAAFSELTGEISRDVAFWLLKITRDTPLLAERCGKQA